MGYIDIHTHILPGLDDGSRDMEQSLTMLQIAYEEGITDIIATPHNMPGKGRASRKTIDEQIRKLQLMADRCHIPIHIWMGTEYYYCEKVLRKLENENIITLGVSEYVLIEFNPLEEKSYIRNAVNAIYGTGYIPIIAHVERYIQLMKDIRAVEDLRKLGARIQVNASSVTGKNGFRIRLYTEKLLQKNMVDFIATDAHSDGHRAPCLKNCADILKKKYGTEYTEQLLYQNAKELLLQNKCQEEKDGTE